MYFLLPLCGEIKLYINILPVFFWHYGSWVQVNFTTVQLQSIKILSIVEVMSLTFCNMFALTVLVVRLPEQCLQSYHLCVSQPIVP